jgi:hypothetical protein
MFKRENKTTTPINICNKAHLELLLFLLVDCISFLIVRRYFLEFLHNLLNLGCYF